MAIAIDKIISALQQPLPGQEAQLRMVGRVRKMPDTVPAHSKQSAVLCLLYPLKAQLHVALMKRREDGTAHSGQVSFPGGKYEDADGNYLQTAIREAREEVGVQSHCFEVLGALTPLYIPVSNFNVHPFVAYATARPTFQLSRAEVAYLLEVPLPELFAPERKVITDVMSPVQKEPIRNVHAYRLADGTIIWGATAMMLSELEVLFERHGILPE